MVAVWLIALSRMLPLRLRLVVTEMRESELLVSEHLVMRDGGFSFSHFFIRKRREDAKFQRSSAVFARNEDCLMT